MVAAASRVRGQRRARVAVRSAATATAVATQRRPPQDALAARRRSAWTAPSRGVVPWSVGFHPAVTLAENYLLPQGILTPRMGGPGRLQRVHRLVGDRNEAFRVMKPRLMRAKHGFPAKNQAQSGQRAEWGAARAGRPPPFERPRAPWAFWDDPGLYGYLRYFRRRDPHVGRSMYRRYEPSKKEASALCVTAHSTRTRVLCASSSTQACKMRLSARYPPLDFLR